MTRVPIWRRTNFYWVVTPRFEVIEELLEIPPPEPISPKA
jgi:hypothetical protein